MPETQKYTETDLILLLRQREQSAFSYLYDNYSGALYGIILSIVPDKELANDVLQEVFVKIWRQVDSYDASKGRLFTWMMNIARNASIDMLRSKGYQKTQDEISKTLNMPLGTVKTRLRSALLQLRELMKN